MYIKFKEDGWVIHTLFRTKSHTIPRIGEHVIIRNITYSVIDIDWELSDEVSSTDTVTISLKH